MIQHDQDMRYILVTRLNKGMKFGEALEQAVKDINSERDKKDVPPPRSLAERHDRRSRSRKRQGAQDQVRHQASSSGKGKGWDTAGLHTTTEKGQEICLNWNSMKARYRFHCGRAHMCQRCLGQHLLHMCGTGKHQEAVGTGGGTAHQWEIYKRGKICRGSGFAPTLGSPHRGGLALGQPANPFFLTDGEGEGSAVCQGDLL